MLKEIRRKGEEREERRCVLYILDYSNHSS
jgi:hypothetical protein